MFRVSQPRISRKLLALFVPIALGLTVIGPPSVAAAPRLALINAATVSGSPSLEEQAAIAAGFAVTVVNDATWATMTSAQFGQYELLIAGDPTCGTVPPGLVASAPVWGPVVLGMAGGRTQAGNRLVIGTDPRYHASQGGNVLITEGIDFAGKQPGRTGMYLDVTCGANFGQAAQILTLVNAASSPTASGAWTINAAPPCGAAASLIASVPGSFPTLSSTNLQGWFCSVHESFPTFKADFAALAVATDTPTHPTCGVDPGTGTEACGEAYILVAGTGIVVVSGSISLAPDDDTNPVGTNHTVTAHVSDATGPLVGQLVTFEVTGVNAGAVGTCSPVTCMSDAAGNVTFTYTGAGGPGDDTIKASFTDAAGSLQSATAQKHWTGVVVGPPATLDLTPATATNPVGTSHCVTATVKDAGGTPTSGITVNFSVAGPNGPLAGSGVTDANGEAQFCYSGTNAGTDTITATAVGGTNPSRTATKTWESGPPETLVLTPPTATNPAGTQHCVTATVRDGFGNPVNGVTVTFDVTGANPTTGAAVTDANGEAQFCYSGINAGTDTIAATAVGGTNPSDTVTKTWEAGTPTILTLDPENATNPAGASHCVTATVTDEFGNPVPGAPVEFLVLGANPQPQTEVVTGLDGTAKFCYVGTHVGDDNIFAEVHIATASPPSDEAHKTWVAGPPVSLVLTPPTATNTVLAQHCVTATVLDAFGNPVPNVTVQFTVTGANTTGGTATTDANGQATFCYTGTDVGNDVITAQVTGTTAAGRAAKVWIPPAVDHYKCYGADQKEPRQRDRDTIVTLKDQFGEARMRLGKAEGLCNPVSKNGEPVFQKEAHFKIYELKAAKKDDGHDDSDRVTTSTTTSSNTSATGDTHNGDNHDGDDDDKDGDAHGLRVEVTNQFGTQTLKVKKATLLFVPASKSEIPPAHRGDDPGAPPRFVDHYLCYEVDGRRIDRTVILEDQFGREQVKVRSPELLCNPVSKNGGRVLQPDRHLVCYTLKSDKDTKRLVNMHDQFGLSVLRTEEAERLCVPSTKRILPPPPGGSD